MQVLWRHWTYAYPKKYIKYHPANQQVRPHTGELYSLFPLRHLLTIDKEWREKGKPYLFGCEKMWEMHKTLLPGVVRFGKK